MTSFHLAVQGLNNGTTLLNLIREIAAKENFNRITGVFAYATSSGVHLLLDALKTSMEEWDSIEKKWVVSIDFARTEPAAIKRLHLLKNSNVRVPFFEEVMLNNFIPAKCFHPKMLLFDTKLGLDKGPAGIVVGSGNLSVSGLSLGFESAIAMSWGKHSIKQVKREYNAVLLETLKITALFDLSTPMTDSMIKKYDKFRPQIKRRQEDDSAIVKLASDKNPELDISKAIAMKTAKNFWIDVDYVTPNRGKGVPGNQIDMQRGSRVFFGFPAAKVSRNESLGDITVKYDDASVTCHMRFGNNSMDKLNLPIPGEAGPDKYENTTLSFEKIQSGSFLLKVGSKAEIIRWKRFSKRQGTLYKMQGGREYGVF